MPRVRDLLEAGLNVIFASNNIRDGFVTFGNADMLEQALLGATAAQALLGPQFRVTKQRGEFIPSTLAPYVMATVHPSSILRAPDDETRQLELRRFIDDLKQLAKAIK